MVEVSIVIPARNESGNILPLLDGIDAAYYLIHSMGSSDDFHERDQRAALNFGNAAACAGVWVRD